MKEPQRPPAREIPLEDYLNLVLKVRSAQRTYWHFPGSQDPKMKRRLLEFALNLEAELDASRVQNLTAILANLPAPFVLVANPTPEDVERFQEMLKQSPTPMTTILQAGQQQLTPSEIQPPDKADPEAFPPWPPPPPSAIK